MIIELATRTTLERATIIHFLASLIGGRREGSLALAAAGCWRGAVAVRPERDGHAVLAPPWGCCSGASSPRSILACACVRRDVKGRRGRRRDDHTAHVGKWRCRCCGRRGRTLWRGIRRGARRHQGGRPGRRRALPVALSRPKARQPRERQATACACAAAVWEQLHLVTALWAVIGQDDAARLHPVLIPIPHRRSRAV